MMRRVLIAGLVGLSFFVVQLASQAMSRCLLAGTEQCSGEQCTTEQCDSPIATACAKSCGGKLATKLLSAVPSTPHSPVLHSAASIALPGDHASLGVTLCCTTPRMNGTLSPTLTTDSLGHRNQPNDHRKPNYKTYDGSLRHLTPPSSHAYWQIALPHSLHFLRRSS